MQIYAFFMQMFKGVQRRKTMITKNEVLFSTQLEIPKTFQFENTFEN